MKGGLASGVPDSAQAGLPTRGTRVRIELTGPVADRDAFGGVVELDTARKAGDTGADAIPPGWNLAIAEIEFHGPEAPETQQ